MLEFLREFITSWWGILILVTIGVLFVALFYKQVFKRMIDILVALIGIIITLIPMALVAIAVRIFLGSPITFHQTRVGKKEKRFKVYKFRTMTDARDEYGELLPDEKRSIKFGMLLRKTSLDELPQLFNVLKGDMSLIGPRPMMEKYIPSDPDVRKMRFSVRPGITGLAQVNGRTDVSYEQRFKNDVKYARKVNILTDIGIFFKTIWILIRSLFIPSSTPKEESLEILKGTVEYEMLKCRGDEYGEFDESIDLVQ